MKNKFCFANLRLSRRHSVPILISAVFACALMQSKLQAQSILWNGPLAAGPHVWNTSTNWTGSNVPDDFPGPGVESGNLARDWTAAATINFSGNTTINGVTYDDTGATGDVAMILASLPTTSIVTLAGTTPTIGVTGTLSITSPIAGTTPWLKEGGGLLVLSGANTFNAALTINNGTVRPTVAAGLGAGGPILVSNVAPASGTDINILELAGGFTFGAGRTLTLRSAVGGGQGRASLINQAGNNTWAGPIVLESPLNQALQSAASTTLTITGNITNGTPATTQMFFRGAGAIVLTTPAPGPSTPPATSTATSASRTAASRSTTTTRWTRGSTSPSAKTTRTPAR
jgi:fibronectin-binding autotransporter adhesin